MQKHTRIVLALAAFAVLPTLSACDSEPPEECADVALDGSEPFVVAPRLTLAPPEGAPPPAEYTFREQGPPEVLVLKKMSGQTITRSRFAKLILSPGALADPPLTCTMSWYLPDTSKPEYTMGIGCSATAPIELWDNYRQTFLANGATPP